MAVDSTSESGVVRLLKAHEPRLDIRPDREMVAVMGAANISTRSYNADTATTSQVIWNQTTPSIRVGVDRTIEVDITWTCEVKGPGEFKTFTLPGQPTGTANECLNPGFGFRQYPLHSVMENLQLRLNDQAFNWEPAESLHALLHYGNTWEDRQYLTGSSPHQPDQFWRYDEIQGGARSEFGSWRAQGMEDGRGWNIWAKRVSATKIQFRLIEQLMISPLNWGEDKQCLFGIQNIDVAITFRPTLERMFSGNFSDMFKATPATTADTKLEFSLATTECKLHITYLQPQANQEVPPRLNYEYYQIRRFQQSINGQIKGSIAAATDFPEVNYNNITLHEIPKRMYVYAAPKSQGVEFSGFDDANFNNLYKNQQEANMTQANFFANIDKISINFDSQDGRLSTLDSYDLWKMSSKNGLTKSFVQWQHGVGSVLCVEFGKDMNLNPLLAPGVRGNFQLSLNVKFKDIRDRCYSSRADEAYKQLEPKEYIAHLVIVPVGVVTIDNQLITTSIGSVTEENIYQAPWMAAGTRVEYSGITGGNLKSVMNLISKGVKVAKGAIPIVGPLVGQMAGDMLSNVKDPRAQMMGQVVNAAVKAMGKGGRSSGGRRTGGGAKVRSASLARRM